jgi:hypothetical protein
METKPRRFTGRQLMIMFIVLCATAVLIPTAAWAVSTGSAVNIVDGTTATSKAAVEPTGRLKVDTGLNSVYGLVPTLTTGSVTANVAYPTSALVHSDDGTGSPAVDADSNCPAGSPCTKVIGPATGQALIITAVHINVFKNTVPGSPFQLIRSSDGTCNQSSFDLVMENVYPAGTGLTDLEYPMPGGMTIPAGKALCIYDNDPAHMAAYVTAWGYSVPAAAVPAASPAAGAPRGAALLQRKP